MLSCRPKLIINWSVLLLKIMSFHNVKVEKSLKSTPFIVKKLAYKEFAQDFNFTSHINILKV